MPFFKISSSNKSHGLCFGNQNSRVHLFYVFPWFGVGLVGCLMPSWISSQGEFGFLGPTRSIAFNFQLLLNSFTDSFKWLSSSQHLKCCWVYTKTELWNLFRNIVLRKFPELWSQTNKNSNFLLLTSCDLGHMPLLLWASFLKWG